MRIYSNVTEQDLINLRKLAEQQKNQRAEKIKNRILKKTHEVKLAESLSPIAKKIDEVINLSQQSLSPITKKLDNIIKGTKQLGEIVKKSKSENNQEMAITPSSLLQETYKSLAEANNSLKLNQDKNHNVSILGVPIRSVVGDNIQVYDNIYELTPEIQSFINSSYTGKSMKNEDDRRTLYNFLVDIGYNGQHDEKTNQNKFFKKLFNQFTNIKKEEPDNLKGEGVKILIPSNIIDIYTRLEVLLGLKLSGHTDTLTEASNLRDELYKLGEIQNKQQYQNALNKFST